MKRILLLYFFVIICCVVKAGIKISAEGPDIVEVGQQFRVEYYVNSQSISSNPRLQEPKGLEVLYGPARSSQSSVQIINGKVSQSSSTTFTYTMVANSIGTFTIPGVSMTVEGNTYTSNSVTIKVIKASNNNGSSQQQSSSNRRQVISSGGSTTINNKDLYISVSANKNQVYEQEPVLLTYKVYTKVNLTQLSGKMPDLKGFMVKEIALPQQKTFSIERVGNENYYTTIWSKYVMFPQQTGKLEVPKIKFEGVVTMANPNIDIFDAFFNGTSGTIEKTKILMAPSVAINVKPLPNKPTDFSGGVGNFTISATLKTSKPKENETMNIQVVVSGTGNLNLIKAPKIDFPAEFDVYDPKTTDHTKLSISGMQGKLVIEYLAVPKRKGHFVIPPIKLVYFDSPTHTYKTIQTNELEVDVAKGEKNIYAGSQQEILVNNDIRYIKTGNVTLSKSIYFIWNTYIYWLIYVLLIIIFVVLWIILQRNIKINNDSLIKRTRHASRVATSRMKKALQSMKTNKPDMFYENTLTALTGFVSDKFNIPISELNKQRIQEELRQRNIDQNIIDSYLGLLDDCELYRYSSVSNSESLQDIYDKAVKVITVLNKN